MSLVGELNTRVCSPSVPGGNNSIQYNSAGIQGGSPNLLYSQSNTNMYIEANIQIANINNLWFGGNQSNIASANFAICANVTSNSLDFLWR